MVRRRFLRRVLLLLVSLTLVLVGAKLARAEGARVEIGTRASVRRLLLEEDFDAARILVERLRSAEAPMDRGALDELVLVLDAWSTAHRPRGTAPTAIADVPQPAPGEDWGRSLSAARELLVRGAYAESARRLDPIVASAPDVSLAARASELRALAREAEAMEARSATDKATPSERAHPPRSSDPPPAGRWYGWQTLIADGAAIAIAPGSPLAALGSYLLASPIIHLAHGRGPAALGSLGIRVGMPIAGFAFGFMAAAPSAMGHGRVDSEERAVLLLCGTALGVLSAIVVDGAVLAKEPAKPVPHRTMPPSLAQRLRPVLEVRREGGVDVGLRATL